MMFFISPMIQGVFSPTVPQRCWAELEKQLIAAADQFLLWSRGWRSPGVRTTETLLFHFLIDVIRWSGFPSICFSRSYEDADDGFTEVMRPMRCKDCFTASPGCS